VGGLFACAASFTVFCNIYSPDLVKSGDASAPQGQGLGWWSGTGSAGCYSAKMPTVADRPKSTDATEDAPIYLAIRELRMGSRNPDGTANANAWQDLGMDVDNTCTSSPTCDTKDPIVSCKPNGAAIPVDGNYCRDNTFGKLEGQASTIPEVGGKYGLNDEAFNCALCRGDYNFIIRISKYNGKDTDDHVRVDFYPSPGLMAPLPWDCSQPTWRNHPCFTADSPWLISDDGVIAKTPGPDLSDAVLADPDAFVKNGYIVVQLPTDTVLWFPGHRALATAFPLKFSKGVVAGRLKKSSDGTWTIDDGTIAGRARKDDVVLGFRLIGFCDSDPNYKLMQNFLSTGLDVLADGRTDPTTTCDGISIGIGFTASQSVAGNLAHVDPLVECAPSGDGGVDGGTDAALDAPKDAPTDGPVDAGKG